MEKQQLSFELLLCWFVQDRAQTSIAQPIFILKTVHQINRCV